mmetsp:Transcript_39502/g.118579  ORF Transcript_39502/g.118579 Transcript_39502/m.118579 type:complete len:88 (-) Transcript_39502:305-568(-)
MVRSKQGISSSNPANKKDEQATTKYPEEKCAPVPTSGSTVGLVDSNGSKRSCNPPCQNKHDGEAERPKSCLRRIVGIIIKRHVVGRM